VPVLKPDRSVRRRHLADVLLFGLPFVGALVLARTTSLLLGACCAAALLGLAALYRQESRLRSSRCPGCGAVLRRSPGEPGARITFVCGDCDIEWDTGLRENSD
jgi:hypothetical protein